MSYDIDMLNSADDMRKRYLAQVGSEITMERRAAAAADLLQHFREEIGEARSVDALVGAIRGAVMTATATAEVMRGYGMPADQQVAFGVAAAVTILLDAYDSEVFAESFGGLA